MVKYRNARVSSKTIQAYDRCSRVRRDGSRDRPPKSARDCILSSPRAHSTAHGVASRAGQSSRALLGVNMCPTRDREREMWPSLRPSLGPLARMEREYGVRVDSTSIQPPGLQVRDDQPQYQNLEELRKRPEYANLDEISREFGYRLCPEGQNLEDEAIYENILSVRRIRSAEVRLVPVSEVPYYEGKGYVATQVLSRSGTFPQCPPHSWSRLQHAFRTQTGSLRIFTVNI